MRIGIQRRNLTLSPAAGLDRHWMVRLFDHPEIYEMFGFGEPAALAMALRLRQPGVVLGIVRLVTNQARIGFVIMFPPTDTASFWEIGYAITSARHRDAFTAINALDSMGCYMWEHHGAKLLGGRTRDDNRQADAVVRRMGFSEVGTVTNLGHTFHLFTQDRAGWERRKARLVEGERLHPSPAGVAFAVLEPPHFEPRTSA